MAALRSSTWLAASLSCAALGGGAALFAGADGLVATAALAVVAVVVLAPLPATAPDKGVMIFLVAFTFGAVLPFWSAVILQVGAIGIPYAAWLHRRGRRGVAVVVLVTSLLVLWGLLALHPNVPDLSTGISGIRKSVFALGGLVLGLSVVPARRWATERFVVALLLGALGVSVLVHVLAPQLEQGIVRQAADHVASFDGNARLQGVFAGPFHVALASVFVLAWGVLRFRRAPALATGCIVVGLLALELSAVRTGYVAAVGALGILPLLAADASRRLRRFAVLAVLAAVLLGALTSFHVIDDSVLVSLESPTADTRFLNRVPTWNEGIERIGESPIIGWGAGAGGATLGEQFGDSRVHVTAHNFFLNYTIEGGLVGLVLVLALVLRLLGTIRFRGSAGSAAALALVSMAIFGLPGTVLDAMPVSYLLLMIVGMAVDLPETSRTESDDVDALPDARRGQAPHGGALQSRRTSHGVARAPGARSTDDRRLARRAVAPPQRDAASGPAGAAPARVAPDLA